MVKDQVTGKGSLAHRKLCGNVFAWLTAEERRALGRAIGDPCRSTANSRSNDQAIASDGASYRKSEPVKTPSPLQKIAFPIFDQFRIFACSLLLLCLPASAEDLPAGTTLEVRLSNATGSDISHRGDPLDATLIAAVSVRGRILIPQGSRVLGTVADVTALGLGLKHSTASIAYAFHTLQLRGGATVPVNTRVIEVETAKERVDDSGAVHGIHPIMSLSSGLSFYAVPLLLLDPPVGAPLLAAKSIIAPSANPEIHFPAGTELILQLTSTVTIPTPNAHTPVVIESFSRSDAAEIEHLLKNSAQRALMGRRPSDIVNMLMIGSREQMDRAFHASGWTQAQPKSLMSLYRMYHALTKRDGYPSAPMNALTLNGVRSSFVHQKSLDTVQKRHHVRVWQYPGRANIWLGTAAEDVGFRFELTHWTHSTEPNIDSERAKVVNDLAFTGCLNAAELFPRSSADLVQDPKEERPIVTDGNMAVIRLNDCLNPNLMAGAEATPAARQRGRLARSLTVLREDLVRSNIAFTAYNTLRFLGRHKAKPTIASAPILHIEPRGLDWLPTLPAPQSRPDQ